MSKRKVFFLGNEFLFLQEWINLNPDYEFNSYNLDNGKLYLIENYSQTYADILDYIEDEFIKFDFIRLCLLFKNGGIFLGDDLIPVIPLNDFISDNIDLITIIIPNKKYMNTNNALFNINFIFLSNSNNSIIKSCIDKYIQLYSNKVEFSWTIWTLNNIFSQVIYEIKTINIMDNIIYTLENYNCLFIKWEDRTKFILNNKLLFKAN